jgi:hypothetical protein
VLGYAPLSANLPMQVIRHFLGRLLPRTARQQHPLLKSRHHKASCFG